MAVQSRQIHSPQDLSPYHRRVCGLLAEGDSPEEIAERLRSNRQAINAVVFRIVKIAGVRNRNHLIAWFASWSVRNPVITSTQEVQNTCQHLTF